MTNAALSHARRWRWGPTTRLGRLAGWLGLAFLGWFVVNQLLIGMQQMIDLPRWPLIAYGLGGLALGLAAGVVALVAIVRKRERSVVAFLATLPALLVLVFLAGELFFPH